MTNLKNKAISGVKWTTVSAVAASLMQLIQVAVLTRYLDKTDFGLMAMALFVIGISQIFIDMGMSNALIHKQRVNKFQLSTLFWLNTMMGIAIFLVIISISPFIAQYYDTPELRGVIDWTAVSFLILPWGQQFEALLRRDLRFKSLSVRDIVSKSIGLVIAVILAYKGFGVYALVYANLSGALASVTLLLILGMKDYRPSFIFSHKSLRNKGFFSFGLFQMGERMINYFNSNFDTILIGKILGMEALGLYNIAKILAMKPYQILNPIITKVAFPVFAKVQNDLIKLRNTYLKVVNILTATNAPVYMLMVLFAKPLIFIVFGSAWLSATPILQLLAVGALCNSIGNPVGSLQLARGRADLGFYWNLIIFIFLPVTIWLGGHWGLLGVALSLTIFKLIVLLLPAWYFFVKPLCDANYKEYLFSFSRSGILAIAASVVPYFCCLAVANAYWLLIVGILSYLATYVIINLIWNKSFIGEVYKVVPVRFLNKEEK
ncbi:MAG TPA: MOP flippase family protein [Edaphocola sp.]|nr:MOP flippase family protein [Edaphocola sp.]